MIGKFWSVFMPHSVYRSVLFCSKTEKTENVNRKPKTAVLIGFNIAKKRGFGAGFDNHNNIMAFNCQAKVKTKNMSDLFLIVSKTCSATSVRNGTKSWTQRERRHLSASR